MPNESKLPEAMSSELYSDADLDHTYWLKTHVLKAQVDVYLETIHDDVMSLIDKVDYIRFLEAVKDEEDEIDEQNARQNAELVCRLVDQLKARLHDWIDERFQEAGWMKWSGLDAPRPDGGQPCR